MANWCHSVHGSGVFSHSLSLSVSVLRRLSVRSNGRRLHKLAGHCQLNENHVSIKIRCEWSHGTAHTFFCAIASNLLNHDRTWTFVVRVACIQPILSSGRGHRVNLSESWMIKQKTRYNNDTLNIWIQYDHNHMEHTHTAQFKQIVRNAFGSLLFHPQSQSTINIREAYRTASPSKCHAFHVLLHRVRSPFVVLRSCYSAKNTFTRLFTALCSVGCDARTLMLILWPPAYSIAAIYRTYDARLVGCGCVRAHRIGKIAITHQQKWANDGMKCVIVMDAACDRYDVCLAWDVWRIAFMPLCSEVYCMSHRHTIWQIVRANPNQIVRLRHVTLIYKSYYFTHFTVCLWCIQSTFHIWHAIEMMKVLLSHHPNVSVSLLPWNHPNSWVGWHSVDAQHCTMGTSTFFGGWTQPLHFQNAMKMTIIKCYYVVSSCEFVNSHLVWRNWLDVINSVNPWMVGMHTTR